MLLQTYILHIQTKTKTVSVIISSTRSTPHQSHFTNISLTTPLLLFPYRNLSKWLSWTDSCPDLAWNVGKRYTVGNTVLKICSHQPANGEPIYCVNSAYNIIPSRKWPPLEVEITPQERHLPDANTKYSEKYINLTWYDFRSTSHTRPYLSENSRHP